MQAARFKIFLTILVIFPTLLRVSTIVLSADNTYFVDDFNDGVAENWTIPRNSCRYNGQSANWTVENKKLGIRINNGSCVTEAIPSEISIPTNASYRFEVDMTMAQSTLMDRNFVFKYQDSRNWYGIHTIGTSIYLQKVVNGVEYFLPNWQSNFPFANNGTYHFVIEIRPTEYKVFVDESLRATVPDTSSTFQNSKAGLQASAGGIPNSEVWFDNIKVTSLDNPSPSPTPTIPPQAGDWELPINYVGRLLDDADKFKSAFWIRLTAAFDHKFPTGIHTPFTGTSYNPTDCLAGTLGISCYDSHNGTDFSKTGGYEVFSVADGVVAYASRHKASSCTPNSGGFGCVVIVGYHNNTFGLFAHLKKIFVSKEQSVDKTTILGEMGKTGCAPSCGEHLHFSVLKPASFGTTTQTLLNFMKPKDWESLLSTIRPLQTPKIAVKPYCNYRAPNGQKFIFIDPAGWKGESQDPWSLPKKQKGCGITSPYLWKFDVGVNP